MGYRYKIIFYCMFIFINSCSFIFQGADDAKIKKQAKSVKIPTSIIKFFVRTAVDKNGVTRWELRAREGRIFEKDSKIYLTDFLMLVYRDGRVVSRLRARRGIIHKKDEKIVAKKKVFLMSENGRTLQTEELYANNRDNTIYNEVYNRITKEDGTVMTGTHLWAHNDLKIFKLKNAWGEMPENTTNKAVGK